jgi:hypothetical protein
VESDCSFGDGNRSFGWRIIDLGSVYVRLVTMYDVDEGKRTEGMGKGKLLLL